jgi:hypothetical protein
VARGPRVVMKSLASSSRSLLAPAAPAMLLLHEPIRDICPVVAVVEMDGKVVEQRARPWVVNPARAVVLKQRGREDGQRWPQPRRARRRKRADVRI